jgi:hypothetical protein
MNDLPGSLKPYLDEQGRVTMWPSARNRKAEQALVADYLISKFERGRDYTEKEVNALLNQYHTFEDSALLRRELFERKLLNRVKDGSRYWRV